MNLTEIIKRCQKKLGETQDGVAGPKTWQGIAKAIGADLSESEPIPATPTLSEQQNASGDRVDERSEAAIATLHRLVQPKARQLVKLAAANGITIKITSGTRTYAEQDKLFAQGNVTKARGGHSNHNFGIAIDFTLFDGKEPIWESPKYKTVGQLGKSLGFTWGGDWESFKDEPHLQFEPAWAEGMSESKMLAELRRRHNNGIDAFT